MNRPQEEEEEEEVVVDKVAGVDVVSKRLFGLCSHTTPMLSVVSVALCSNIHLCALSIASSSNDDSVLEVG